ncbi:type II secretion system F family protein [Candidatus Peregrinibacteria bacterium]|jgi:type IV pilus assembly protein PilC|nr:type II secretion system F family protein [Candidatus Peregrinibacteria bacterium]MBT7736395.1 type II secretion system F family protein [Candidatus Peregrinibacteria bacterium]
MAKYEYVVTDDNGRKNTGFIDSSSREVALKKVREEFPDKIVISVTEKAKGRFYFTFKPSLSFQEKMLFTKNLATMIKVGITVTESLEILANQASKKNVKSMYEDIIEMIRSGQTLANSLRKYNYIFSDLFINMIQTGEESGNLEKTLVYLDRQLEKEYETRKKIVGAMIYPIVIICLTVVMAIGIVVFIMPKITSIFGKFDIVLPLPTRILIALSGFIGNHTLLAAAIGIGTVAFLITIFKVKFLKPFWHKVAIYTPIFGGIIIAGNLARFSRTLNSLLQTGVPITDSLEITGRMIGNSMYGKAIKEASEKVEQGGHLGESFEGYEKLFPDMATKMMFIGEKTGSMEVATKRLAELYEGVVDSKTRNISTLIEPFLLVLMAVMVGGIALSIIMPIYQLPNLLGQ